MAIIGVLVAISIPIFTGQLKKARLATNQANARAAYAAVVADLLDKQESTGTETYNIEKGAIDSSGTSSATVKMTGELQTWKPDDNNLGATTYKYWKVTIGSDGAATFEAGPAKS